MISFKSKTKLFFLDKDTFVHTVYGIMLHSTCHRLHWYVTWWRNPLAPKTTVLPRI